MIVETSPATSCRILTTISVSVAVNSMTLKACRMCKVFLPHPFDLDGLRQLAKWHNRELAFAFNIVGLGPLFYALRFASAKESIFIKDNDTLNFAGFK